MRNVSTACPTRLRPADLSDRSHPISRFHRVAYLMQVAQDLHLGYMSTDDRATALAPPVAADAIAPSEAVEAAKNNLTYGAGDGAGWVLVRKEHRLVFELSPN